MRRARLTAGWALGVAIATAIATRAAATAGQDWPQWRGANRDAKAAGFVAPSPWPDKLNQQWKVTVGDGVATPALVGDRVFVFSRQNDNEVTRALDLASGKVLWEDKYPAAVVRGPAGSFSGPRASPAVSEDGKIVVTIGVHGTVSALSADDGKLLWRKTDGSAGEPRFSVASSPLIVGDGTVVAQFGGSSRGGIVAYDLATGAERWKWTGESPAYASPALMTIGDVRLVIAETEQSILAVRTSDGKAVWKSPLPAGGPGAYNAASPVVVGPLLIYCGGGKGIRAVKFDASADGVRAAEVWANTDKSLQFSTPIAKDGLLYGISAANELFCLNLDTGKVAWAQALPGGGDGPGMGGGPRGPGGGRRGPGGFGPPDGGGGPGGPGGPPGGGFGGRRGGMGPMGLGGYGSLVDAGPDLVALTPGSELIVFQPTEKQYTQLAKLKVAQTPTYAYPILSGPRVLIKDQDSVVFWTLPAAP